MPIYLIFSCEIVVFSLLIGAFMDSLIFGLSILGGSGLIMFTLYERWYKALPLVWGATLLGSLTTLLWTSYIDDWLGTTFIALIFSLLFGFVCYVLNDYFFKTYQV